MFESRGNDTVLEAMNERIQLALLMLNLFVIFVFGLLT